MIPLRDVVPSKRLPVMTVLLIIINVFIFLKEISLGASLEKFIANFAVIPASFLNLGIFSLDNFIQKNLSLVSALFLHGGWLHLIGNMWYLWVFGDNVEEKFGHIRFVIFYLLSGIFGNLAHIYMNAHSQVPVLGASGCIAGILGAYFLLFPGAKIITLLPIFFFWTVVEIPSFFFLGIWFLIQFINGFFMMPCGQERTCVAWWAHIGGFISGMILTFLFIPKRKKRVRY